MENRCSSSSQPSGVRLLALLQGQWKEILRREESNAFLMHLYGTGTHWVAFERSACQSEHFIHDLPKVEEGIDRLSFKMPVLRNREYGVWHDRQTEYLSKYDVNKN